MLINLSGFEVATIITLILFSWAFLCGSNDIPECAFIFGLFVLIIGFTIAGLKHQEYATKVYENIHEEINKGWVDSTENGYYTTPTSKENDLIVTYNPETGAYGVFRK